MAARAVLEQLTHRVVVRRRLPAPFTATRIYASSEGGLRYLRPRLDGVDPVLLRLVSEFVRPGDAVWDIGANLGLFTFAASQKSGPDGRVLAIEPDISLTRLLRRSAAANHGHAQVDVLPVAVSDNVGVAEFCIARRNRSTSHLDGFGTTQTGGVRATQLVPTVTLEWLAAHFPAPQVVKIDVEAAEMQVLTGAAGILGAVPTIICEVAGHNAARVGGLLTSHGYKLYDVQDSAADRAPKTSAPPNTLAIRTPSVS
jgi:FkbM family methyltransferase